MILCFVMLNLTELFCNISYGYIPGIDYLVIYPCTKLYEKHTQKTFLRFLSFSRVFYENVGKINLHQLAQVSHHYVTHPATDYNVSHVNIFVATLGADV